MFKIFKRFPSYFELITVAEISFLIIILIFNVLYFDRSKLFGNSASRILLAVGPLLKIGSPYKDLWEVVPPGYLVITSLWFIFFGISVHSYVLLYLILAALIGVFLVMILRKIFRSRIIEIAIFFPAIFTLFSPAIQTDLGSIEIFGTAFTLCALVILLYLKNTFLKLAISTGLIFFAGQIKETFMFSILGVVPFYVERYRSVKLKRSFVYNFFLSLLGPLSVIFTILLYLLITGAFKGYSQVLLDKTHYIHIYTSPLQIISSFFQILDLFLKTYLSFPYLFWILFVLNIIIFFSEFFRFKLKYLNLVIHSKITFETTKLMKFIFSSVNTFGTVLIIFGLLFGFIMYGQFSLDIREFPIATAFYILIGLLMINPLQFITTRLLGKRNIYIKNYLPIIFLLIITMPSVPIFKGYSNFQKSEKYSLDVDKAISARVPKNECILHIYGWEVSSTYIDTKRKPCSKFFLTNHIYNEPWLRKEYVKEILNNPAYAVLYNEKGSDLNVQVFEKEILNFSKILQNCYVLDPVYRNYNNYFFAPVNLYWPDPTLTRQQLMLCISNNSGSIN